MIPYGSLRYNQVRQKSSHNSFGEDEGLYDQIIYWRLRSIELDINALSLGGTPKARRKAAPPGEWLIYHDTPLPTPPSSVRTLNQALKVLAGVNRVLPSHEVITVFLDTSASSLHAAGHDPSSLDEALKTLDGFLQADGTLGAGKTAIFTPSDLLSSAKTLQEAVTGANGKWPLLSALRGKFIFVITGDGVWDYYGADTRDVKKQVAFVAPRVDANGDTRQLRFVVPPIPKRAAKRRGGFVAEAQGIPATDLGGLDPSEHEERVREHLRLLPNAVFVNVPYSADNLAVGPAVLKEGLVARLFPVTLSPLHDDLNTQSDWNAARAARFHHLATNEINAIQHPFTATNTPGGWPFEVIDSITDRSEELDDLHAGDPIRRDVIGLRVHSQDMARNDSCAYYFADIGDLTDISITAVISSPNSTVKAWAKGHLMARASLDPSSDYIAICRPAKDNPIQVQIRRGGKYEERPYIPQVVKDLDLRQDTTVFLRLEITAGRTSALASASVTGAGAEWDPIGSAVTFERPLTCLGIAASSHDGDPIVFQFKILEVQPAVPPGRLKLVRLGDRVTDGSVLRNQFAASALR